MKIKKSASTKSGKIQREVKESDIWNRDESSRLRNYIITESKKQSPERMIKNQMLGIKYQMQDYIEKGSIDKEMRILDFVRLYLKILKISQKEFAAKFEMKDSNLYKYLTGERKLNPDLVMKLSSFSHTPPEMWYYIQTKNELFELKKEKKGMEKYEKYDYEKLMLNSVA